MGSVETICSFQAFGLNLCKLRAQCELTMLILCLWHIIIKNILFMRTILVPRTGHLGLNEIDFRSHLTYSFEVAWFKTHVTFNIWSTADLDWILISAKKTQPMWHPSQNQDPLFFMI